MFSKQYKCPERRDTKLDALRDGALSCKCLERLDTTKLNTLRDGTEIDLMSSPSVPKMTQLCSKLDVV